MKRAVGPRAHRDLACERGICAAGATQEAEAGAAMLEAGGNAVDAVVAAAFVAFVVEQVDCGLGGFARVSLWNPVAGQHLSFDGYVRAPAAAHERMFEVEPSAASTYYGHPPTRGDRARHGPLAPAVPGAVAALCEAHAACGRLPLGQVLEPAIAAARQGPPFTWRDALVIARLRERIEALPDAAAVLLPQGRLPATPIQSADGDRFDTAALARTLERIAAEGPDGFYRGPVAEAIGGHVERLGGILRAEDLAAYRASVVRERPARYRDCEYVTSLDPVGYEALGILDGLEVGTMEPDGFAYRHAMAEAMGCAFTDALTHYGDPAFVPSPVTGLRSEGFAAARRADIDARRALPRPIAPGDPWPYDPQRPPGGPAPEPSQAGWEGTSQMVAADREGWFASIITAVGWDYGSLVYVPEAGVFLNNGMSYFDPRPGRPGSIAPGKMPMFGAPPLVMTQSGTPRLACAGSGGYRIQSAVLHAAVHTLDYGMAPSQALDHPRVHCQGQETYVDARIAPATLQQLREAGHRVVVLEDDASTWHFGRACLAARDPRTGALVASAAPHWLTAVAGC